MTTLAPELIDVDALIPDGIEPVEHLRCWNYLDGKLTSITNGEPWTPGEALTARCTAGGGKAYSWNIVRRGWTFEQAQSHATHINQMGSQYYGYSIYLPAPVTRPAWCPNPTNVLLPPGYGFELVETTHDAPDEGCTCGIYAAATKKQLPDSGHVYGKVKLWGKVVPGENGVRAQYAYPSEFHVHPSMLDDPALKAFGVPLIATDSARVPTPVASRGGLIQFIGTNTGSLTYPTRSKRRPWVAFAIGANLGACALNLSLVGLHVFH